MVGGGVLIRWLLEEELGDDDPFADSSRRRLVRALVSSPIAAGTWHLSWSNSHAFPKGITSQVYRLAGRPQYAT